MSKLTDREIIEITRAYVTQKKYTELLEEQIERMLNDKYRRDKQVEGRKYRT